MKQNLDLIRALARNAGLKEAWRENGTVEHDGRTWVLLEAWERVAGRLEAWAVPVDDPRRMRILVAA